MKEELTIFYTDDDLDDLYFFTDIVQSIGKQYRIVTQNNGKQLLDALNTAPPNPYLVFLDINMPGMNGLETLQKLRGNDKHKMLPVIMLSTSDDDAIMEKARFLGATYYVTKSGDFNELKNSLQHVLSINWASFITTDKNFIYNY